MASSTAPSPKDEFLVDEAKRNLIELVRSRLEVMFEVQIKFGKRSPDPPGYWVNLVGEENNRRLAKEYVKCLCNPEETMNVPYPAELHSFVSSSKVHQQLETQSHAAIIFTDTYEACIMGSQLAVILAMSSLEDLIHRYQDEGLADENSGRLNSERTNSSKSSIVLDAALKRQLSKHNTDWDLTEDDAAMPDAVKRVMLGWIMEQDQTESADFQDDKKKHKAVNDEIVQIDNDSDCEVILDSKEKDRDQTIVMKASKPPTGFKTIGNNVAIVTPGTSGIVADKQSGSVAKVDENFVGKLKRDTKTLTDGVVIDLLSADSPQQSRLKTDKKRDEVKRSDVTRGFDAPDCSILTDHYVDPAAAVIAKENKKEDGVLVNIPAGDSMYYNQVKDYALKNGYTEPEVASIYNDFGSCLETREFIEALSARRKEMELKRQSPTDMLIPGMDKVELKTDDNLNNSADMPKKGKGKNKNGKSNIHEKEFKEKSHSATPAKDLLKPYFDKLGRDSESENETLSADELKKNYNEERQKALPSAKSPNKKTKKKGFFEKRPVIPETFKKDTPKLDNKNNGNEVTSKKINKKENQQTTDDIEAVGDGRGLMKGWQTDHAVGGATNVDERRPILDRLDSIHLPPGANVSNAMYAFDEDLQGFTKVEPNRRTHKDKSDGDGLLGNYGKKHNREEDRHAAYTEASKGQRSPSPKRRSIEEDHKMKETGARNKTTLTRDFELSPSVHDAGRQGHQGRKALRYIVIDGSNVAMEHSNGKIFSCKGIALCVDYFLKRGHREITVFVPQYRRKAPSYTNKIKDQHILEELNTKAYLTFTPSRQLLGGKNLVSYDDRFILKLAVETEGIIVSNDNYRDLMREKEEFRTVVEQRLLMFSFVGDLFMPPDDPLGRNGPNLDEFLSKPDPRYVQQRVRYPPVYDNRYVQNIPTYPGNQYPGVSGVQGMKFSQVAANRNYSSHTQGPKFSQVASNRNYPPHTQLAPHAQPRHPHAQPKQTHATRERHPTPQQTRTVSDTAALLTELRQIFPDNDDKMNIIMTNHPNETDLNKLTLYLLDIIQ